MKKILLSTLAFLSLGAMLLAQDSTAFKGLPTSTLPKGLEARYIKIATPIGSNLRLDTNFAVECRFFMDSNMVTGTANLISTHGTSGGFELKVVNQEVLFNIYNSSNSIARTFTFGTRDTVILNQWNYVGLSYFSEYGSVRQVINGRSLKGKLGAPQPTPVVNENPVLHLGANGSTSFVDLTPTIDEVRIWKYERSSADMLAFEDSCLPANSPNLLAHYTFDGATDKNILDLSGNGNDGEVNAFRATSWVSGAFSCTDKTNSFKTATTNSINVFPNPAKNIINIQSLNNPNFSYTLTDALGKVCLKGESTQNGIDISKLNTGIFYLILNNGQESYSQKIIKQ